MNKSVYTFKNLLAWQKAYELALLIYKCTKLFPKNEIFSLTSQIRRASVSVISNIAEGFKKNSKKERVHFYKIAECSLGEVKCQVMLSKDLDYINVEQYKELEDLQNRVGRLLNGWIQKQK